MLLESLEYFTDMLGVLFQVLGVDEDVIEIDDHEHVEEIGEDVIHEVLEHCWHICEPKGHHTPFEGSVVGVESGFPFVTLSDLDQVICMAEVKFCICISRLFLVHPIDLSLVVKDNDLFW